MLMCLRLLSVLSLLLAWTACGPPESGSTSTPAENVATGKTVGLSQLQGTPQYSVERINDTVAPIFHQPVRVAAGSPLIIVGWAVDEQHQSSAGGVDVVVDGAPFSATYGLERADVAAYLRLPAYKNCGFTVTLPPSKIASKGRHELSLRILTNDGKSFFGGAKIELEVR